MKKSIKSIVVLSVICIAVAAILATINYITKPIIEKNAMMAAQESLREVLEGAEEFEEIDLPENAPATITGVFRETNGKGYAVTVATSSSYTQNQSPMTFTVGVSSDGVITGIKITNYSESKDFGAYPESFIGKDSALSGVDLVAGVTYSSTAFKNAVADVFEALSEVAK